jgi:hypothetical protein
LLRARKGVFYSLTASCQINKKDELKNKYEYDGKMS